MLQHSTDSVTGCDLAHLHDQFISVEHRSGFELRRVEAFRRVVTIEVCSMSHPAIPVLAGAVISSDIIIGYV